MCNHHHDGNVCATLFTLPVISCLLLQYNLLILLPDEQERKWSLRGLRNLAILSSGRTRYVWFRFPVLFPRYHTTSSNKRQCISQQAELKFLFTYFCELLAKWDKAATLSGSQRSCWYQIEHLLSAGISTNQ